MLNSSYVDNVVDTSESESENELVSVSGQLPSQLAAQLPTVAVEKSSDVHVGPRFHYNSPVTVNHYITVKGKDDVESLAENLYKNTGTITPQPPEGANPVVSDVAPSHPSKDVLTFQKHAWLRNRYVWSLLVSMLVTAFITALVVVLSGEESKNTPPCKNPLNWQHVVMCYVASWAHRREDQGRFTVDSIDPTLCTHLVYGFAVINMNTNAIESADPAYDLGENGGTGAYRKMTSLKRDYPHLKVLLSMGGWEERRGKDYSEVADSLSRRKAVITSVLEFLREYNFDGLDLNWKYLAEGKGVPADRENFVSLLKEFREEFDKFGLLLTAPVAVLPDIIERSYDIPAVSQYLHYMFALCYDYYGHWNSQTGPNAPLYPPYDDDDDNADDRNVESSINTVLLKGADPNKLVLGLPLNGRIFKLKDPESGAGFQKESEGAGMGGPYLQDPGFWGYNEICLVVDNPTNNWTKYWDNITHTPYASKGDQFISYDDAISLTDKVKLAVHEKLAGVIVHSLDMDDFRGSCNFGRNGSTGYPLMRAINNALKNSVSWKKFPCLSRSSATEPVN